MYLFVCVWLYLALASRFLHTPWNKCCCTEVNFFFHVQNEPTTLTIWRVKEKCTIDPNGSLNPFRRRSRLSKPISGLPLPAIPVFISCCPWYAWNQDVALLGSGTVTLCAVATMRACSHISCKQPDEAEVPRVARRFLHQTRRPANP